MDVLTYAVPSSSGLVAHLTGGHTVIGAQCVLALLLSTHPGLLAFIDIWRGSHWLVQMEG